MRSGNGRHDYLNSAVLLEQGSVGTMNSRTLLRATYCTQIQLTDQNSTGRGLGTGLPLQEFTQIINSFDKGGHM
jgi:hypothetical protein